MAAAVSETPAANTLASATIDATPALNAAILLTIRKLIKVEPCVRRHNQRMSAIVVSIARPEDAEQVVSIYEWLFAPPGGRPPDWNQERAAAAVRRLLSTDTATLLVARLEGELVGFCTAYEDIDSIRFGRRVWVEDLAVHPERRSMGIGKQLLDEAKRWARERGAEWLRLESGEARTEAHRFYEREQPSSRSIAFGWRL